jgi:hypothetical protein
MRQAVHTLFAKVIGSWSTGVDWALGHAPMITHINVPVKRLSGCFTLISVT